MKMETTSKAEFFRKRGPDMLAFMSEFLSDQIKKEGISERRANEIGVVVMEKLLFEFGGQNLYFPTGSILKKSEKAHDIYDKYEKGALIEELAHEYGNSIQWIYKLITGERARRRAEREAERTAGKKKEHQRWKREN